ncbi:HAMP domain-containing protein [Deinococcus sp. KNUC1210]|uniref:HAMP domain-containing protein n=1 Tax=Deinococcus sp. KNUC1210 TaxID=2917691 RepID=UPI001EF07AE7|nr:HAMP domain-containing protein [Deinococcus sp. KNUC1210]ULH14785.1 HAMP domain-containing protein [Deinococcus sp. KNUC1210]
MWRASSRTVLVSLLVGMLLVVGVTVGSMLFFSNLVVQRQIARLPPDLRDQFRDRSDAGTTSFSSTSHTDAGDGHSASKGTSPAVPVGGSQLQHSQAASMPNMATFAHPVLIGPVMPLNVLKLTTYPVRRANGFLRDVGESLRAASLVSAIFGLIVAVLLARRIARPISAVSEAAARVAAGDLSVRARLLPGDRETTELARSFNAMAHGLELLEQERRDTVASIAHELRTP